VNTFAGFWVDGAVRVPEKPVVVAKWKECGNCEIVVKTNFMAWGDIFWLDTSTPDSLTPEQAFVLLKVLHPDLVHITKANQLNYNCHFSCNRDHGIIAWKSTQVFPPVEKWRPAKESDKGKKCRVYEIDGDLIDFPDAIFCGFHPNGTCIVDTGKYGLLPYAGCEVLEQ
jgi:hypothetical protein